MLEDEEVKKLQEEEKRLKEAMENFKEEAKEGLNEFYKRYAEDKLKEILELNRRLEEIHSGKESLINIRLKLDELVRIAISNLTNKRIITQYKISYRYYYSKANVILSRNGIYVKPAYYERGTKVEDFNTLVKILTQFDLSCYVKNEEKKERLRKLHEILSNYIGKDKLYDIAKFEHKLQEERLFYTRDNMTFTKFKANLIKRVGISYDPSNNIRIGFGGWELTDETIYLPLINGSSFYYDIFKLSQIWDIIGKPLYKIANEFEKVQKKNLKVLKEMQEAFGDLLLIRRI